MAQTDPTREQTPALALSHPLRTGALSTRKPTRFDLAPDAATRKAMAQELGLIDLPYFRFKGEIRPAGHRDFMLEAVLEATVVQACSISLAPVKSGLKETALRRYLADWVEPEADEVEMPEDDSFEPVPEVIDVGGVAMEALLLGLPLYPRAEGVDLGEAVFAPPGAEPLRDDDLKPFAGLAALKQQLESKDDG